MAEKDLTSTPLLEELAGKGESMASELLQSNSSLMQVYDTSAFECYIQFSEDSLKGECTDKAHKDWISVYGLDMAAALPVKRSRSSGSVNSTERVSFDDIKFTKAIDKSTPNLIGFCAAAKTSDATIHICRSLEGKQQVFFEIKLTKSFISSSSIICSDDEASIPMELITLDYDAISVTQKVDNVEFKWDLKKNK